MVDTIGTIASAMFEYPIGALKDSARPAYWVPDEDIENCCSCDRKFDDGGADSKSGSAQSQKASLKVHHCRACGKGVCSDCSKSRKPVHLRGWDTPVRICDMCAAITQ